MSIYTFTIVTVIVRNVEACKKRVSVHFNNHIHTVKEKQSKTVRNPAMEPQFEYSLVKIDDS